MSFLILRSSTSAASLASDWLARSTASGVVWAHDFQSSAEVDNFRISGGIGNDPENTQGNDCIWVADGITGGALQFTVPQSASETSHGYWGRPFSALQAGGNGRAEADRADGWPAPLPWDPAGNVNELGEWGAGYITHPDYFSHPSRGNGVNGFTLVSGVNDYFLQIRFRHSAGRFVADTPDGKLAMIMTTGDGPDIGTGQPRTANQEIVFKSEPTGTCYMYTNRGSRSNSFMHDTQGSSVTYDGSAQPGGMLAATCPSRGTGSPGCVTYDDSGWWTALFYVKPGHDGGNGDDPIMVGNTANDTIVRAWIAGPGETTYRPWYDKTNLVMSFGENDPWPFGYNALILSAFMNDVPSPLAGWWVRYGQLVLSRLSIACPQA
jgi:hypothetical protein